MRLQQAQIGGYLVAGLQQNDVTRHQVFTFNGMALIAAQHGSVRGQHLADGIHRIFSLAFLNEADDGVCDHYRQNDGRIRPMLQPARDEGGPEQHVDQDIVELQKEAHEQTASGRLRQAVRTVTFEPCLRLSLAQARRPRVQFGKHGFHGNVMPILPSFRLLPGCSLHACLPWC